MIYILYIETHNHVHTVYDGVSAVKSGNQVRLLTEAKLPPVEMDSEAAK